jgi:hypothetical protein
MIIVLNVVFYIYFVSFWNKLHDIVKYIIFTMSVIAEISYILTFLWNPGIPPQTMNISYFEKNKDKLKIKKHMICKICQVVMNLDEYTEHCEDCDMCIEGISILTPGHDHHCAWISKCIGRGNVVFFYFFLVFTLLLFAFLLFGTATLTR